MQTIALFLTEPATICSSPCSLHLHLFTVSYVCDPQAPSSSSYPLATIDSEMLRATEQLTWTAKLDRFKRGCDDSRPAGPSRDHTETGAWQNFSGSHLTCKVIFTKPIDKPWPSSHNTASQESTPGAKPEPSVDRQLRIMVECEEDLNFSSGNAALTDHGGAASSQLPSASQPTSRLTLVRQSSNGGDGETALTGDIRFAWTGIA